MFEKLEQATIDVEGMTCAHCQKRVTDALRGLKGVKSAAVDLEKKQAAVSYNPAKTGLPELEKAITDAGYTVTGTAASTQD